MNNPHHFLTIPLKNTFAVDLSGPINKFLKATTSDKEDYTASVEGFNRLRNESLLRGSVKDDVNRLLCYYDQVHAIEAKLPISENQIRICFKWQDAFSTGGLFGGKQKINSSWKLAFEKACVLYNITHVYTELAIAQSLSSEGQMKIALKYFQSASGIFSYLKNYAIANSLSNHSIDFDANVLSSLSWLMLAQAAEIIYLKSATIQDEIASQVAAHVADCYREALTSAKTETAKKILPDTFLNTIGVKMLFFQSKTEFHAGKHAGKQSKHGYEVVRLGLGKELIDRAINKCSVSSFTPFLRDYQEEISRLAAVTRRDNDCIYSDRLPDVKTLEAIVAKPIAKDIPVSFPMSTDFRDLFAAMIPIAMINALNMFNVKRAEIMNSEVNRLQQATVVLNSYLASLNLPAAIEDRGGHEIPASIAEKSNMIRQRGGIQVLEQLMNDLPVAATRNREILDETIRMLDEEERSDAELRNQLGERWTRTPSRQLTVPLREEAKRNIENIQKAMKSDENVKAKYNQYRDGILLLSKHPHEIASLLPAATAVGALRDTFVIRDLQRLMEEVEAIKNERDVIEMQLKTSDSDGIRARLISSCQEANMIDENAIVVNEIESIFAPLREQIQSYLKRQEQLVGNIERAHNRFQEETKGNSSSALREEMLKNLARAYDAFQELLANLNEGTKFYREFTPMLLKFQTKVNDFVFARKTEKDDLMQDIQRGIVGRNPYSGNSSAGFSHAPSNYSTPAASYTTNHFNPMPPTNPNLFGAAHLNPYGQPYMPTAPGYNPYNPYVHTMAPPYPSSAAPPYPQQGYGIPGPQQNNPRRR